MVTGGGGRAAPPLSLPVPGDALADGLGYVRRESSRRQAAAWNDVLADDPVLGPVSGCVVGVGERRDGLYPLVWVAR